VFVIRGVVEETSCQSAHGAALLLRVRRVENEIARGAELELAVARLLAFEQARHSRRQGERRGVLDGDPPAALEYCDVGYTLEATTRDLDDATLDAHSIMRLPITHEPGTARALDRALLRLRVPPRLVAHAGRHVVADANEHAVRERLEERLAHRRDLHGIFGPHNDAQGWHFSHAGLLVAALKRGLLLAHWPAAFAQFAIALAF